ncbi:hypothetical protein KKB83_01520 [Patescibacteria group bacterium]|nr:hypothetical protein [Patescibacteria group bacterium]
MRKFRKSNKKYQFKSPAVKSKVSEREKKAYSKLVLAFVSLVAFSVLIYLKGIDFIALYSAFWRPETEIPITPAPVSHLLIPEVYALPSAIKEDQSLRISGTATAGTKVVITVNDTETAYLLADAQGNFEVTIEDELKEGENIISAFSTDNQDNYSHPSPVQIVALDTRPPELELEYPQDQEIINQKNNVIRIRGHTESSKITVTVNGYRAIVDLEGNFSYALSLADDENQIKVVAKDEVGHETEVERVVIFEGEDS